MKHRPGLTLALVVLLAVIAGFFAYPSGLGDKWRPWRLGLDLIGGSHLTYRVDLSGVADSEKESVLNGLRDVIEERVNLFGVSEPQVYLAHAEGETNLIVELAGIKDVSQAITEIGETPFLEFEEVVPLDGSLGIEGESEGDGQSLGFLATELSGRHIVSAELGFNRTTSAPEIYFTLNDEGAAIFQELTRKNAGKPLCVFIDGRPIIENDVNGSCPIVQGEIAGGHAQITGGFTLEGARKLVERFNAGALPAPITLINQQTTSAALGEDSLRAMILAGLIAAAAVALFMLIYYRKLGIFAALALFIYIILTLGVFKIVPVTLTLAGLAGFVLTIGMAVDANILIFERIKEEEKKGIPARSAVQEGFRHAWSSIRDANTSTLITAAVLYYFSSGFVRGFALTLFIGVLVSLLSAVVTTRAMLGVFASWKDRIEKRKRDPSQNTLQTS